MAAIIKYDPDSKNVNLRFAPQRRGIACCNDEKDAPVYP